MIRDNSKYDASRWRVMILHLPDAEARLVTCLVDRLRENLAVELGCDTNGEPVDADGAVRAQLRALLASNRVY
ncbi:MAG: hypothetical protein PF630_00670 [Gammaproteobacteria bacterium]|jgi:hypothetical protein|nr:hypothetical protein [Gammaproteobacteria bacterium]